MTATLTPTTEEGDEALEDPGAVSGEPLLRGFTLDVRALWE